MHARLGFGIAIGVGAAHRQRGALDPRLVALHQVHQIGFPAARFGPAGVHPQQHLAPVLGLHPTLAGVDREQRVVGVVRPAEHQGQFFAVKQVQQGARVALDLGFDLGVVLGLGQFQQFLQVAGLGCDAAPLVHLRLQRRQPLHHPLRVRGVVPEAGGGGLFGEPDYLVFFTGQVKVAPRSQRCARPGGPASPLMVRPQ